VEDGSEKPNAGTPRVSRHSDSFRLWRGLGWRLNEPFLRDPVNVSLLGWKESGVSPSSKLAEWIPATHPVGLYPYHVILLGTRRPRVDGLVIGLRHARRRNEFESKFYKSAIEFIRTVSAPNNESESVFTDAVWLPTAIRACPNALSA